MRNNPQGREFSLFCVCVSVGYVLSSSHYSTSWGFVQWTPCYSSHHLWVNQRHFHLRGTVSPFLVLCRGNSAETITALCVLLCFCVFVCVLQTHSNETIGSIRWKISEHLSCPVDNVQIFAHDSVVSLHVNLSVTGTLCSSFVLKTELYLLFPHQSILPLSQSCVSPEASTHYKLQIRAQKNQSGPGATSSLLVAWFAASIVRQGKHSLVQPQSLFFSHTVPSLLLHRVLVDHESGPEAAVPAWLQRWAEPDCEELGHRHSVWQLRVLGLRLQQFQLSCLQLGLRLGAGNSSDTWL